jgi:hypothetical protein
MFSIGFRQIAFFGFCMSAIMFIRMAFVMATINIGFNRDFLTTWLTGWRVRFIVPLPLSFLQKIMKRGKNGMA